LSLRRVLKLSFPRKNVKVVILAKAGIHIISYLVKWIPAFAGMTCLGRIQEWHVWVVYGNDMLRLYIGMTL